MKTDKQEKNINIIYEIGCLFIPIISEKDVLAGVSNIKLSLEKLNCGFLSGDGPNIKDLAYPIDKVINGEKHLFAKAYFVWLKFTANPDNLINLKKNLDGNKNILRYLLIKTIEKDILVSSQKKVFANIITEEKNKKIIKPAKIVKKEEATPIKISEEVPKEKDVKKAKDLDETIDKLVIK